MVQHSSIDHSGVPGVGGGGLTLIEQHAASASATLDFTSFISSTYDEYLIEGVGLRPATSGVDLLCRVGTGGGPTYDTTNYYGALRAGTGTVSVSGATGTPQQGSSNGAKTQADAPGGGIMVAKAIANDAAYGQVSFSLRLTNPQSTSKHKHVFGHSVWHDGTEVFMAMCGYLYASTTALTAVRFLMSSGNITSGDVRIYGISK